jgi:class 3 adenylate cyclase
VNDPASDADRKGPLGPYGYIPTSFHPDHSVDQEIRHALVVSWDLADSTKKIVSEGGSNEACWEAQSYSLQVIEGPLGDYGPDITLPTGDGFLWIYNTDRFVPFPDVSFKTLLMASQPVIRRLFVYQDNRADSRSRTDANGIEQVHENLRIFGSTMLDGRFGVAAGRVYVHDCESPRFGHWIAPVGLPLYLASRLCKLAPFGGILLEDRVLPEGVSADFYVPRNLQVTKEEVEPKGWDRPVKVWRIAPRA